MTVGSIEVRCVGSKMVVFFKKYLRLFKNLKEKP